jgi:hypothetical protein
MDRSQAIAAALAAAGLDDDLAHIVDEQLELPSEAWPPCCDSGCDPCVERVNSATRHARRLLGLGEPG